MSTTRIVGSLVSKNGVTLFLGDGTSEVLTKDAWKTQDILMAIMLPIAAQGFAEIDLNIYKLDRIVQALVDDQIKVEKAEGGRVAIVVDNERIENAEVLKTQLEAVAHDPHAVTGMKIFLREFAKVAKNRRYSADDLLKFMQRADLPIADDGSIIGYKILNRGADGVFRSPHSGKSGSVPQRVGSIVQMPEEKVDPSRRNDCSHGLHICSRSYIGSFSGQALTLVKINVADVIAVPEYNTNKMRVSRYQIIGELSRAAYDQLRNDKSFTGDTEGAALLRAVIAGEYPPAIEVVTDPGDGSGIKVEQIQGGKAPTSRRKAKDVKLKPDENAEKVKNDPKALQKAFDEALTTSAKTSNADAITAASKSKKPEPKKFGVQPYVPLPTAAELKNGAKPVPLAPKIVEEPAKKPSKSKPKKAPAPTPAPIAEVSADKVAPNAKILRDSPAAEKLAEAQRLKDGGWSLREIEKHLGMCRKSLGKKLT